MSIKTQIIDGYGSGNRVKVGEEGELSVVVHPHPPNDESIGPIPFRQYFTDNGTLSGVTSMVHDGSTATGSVKDFYISSDSEYDIYINSISIEIADDGTPTLNKFGSLTALTNGVGFYWFSQNEGLYVLHEGIKTNKEFIRIATASAGFGDGVNAFLADVSGGGTEKSYFPLIDFSESYGLPWGLRLRKGTTDRIVFRIQDNLSTLFTFNAQAFGIRI